MTTKAVERKVEEFWPEVVLNVSSSMPILPKVDSNELQFYILKIEAKMTAMINRLKEKFLSPNISM